MTNVDIASIVADIIRWHTRGVYASRAKGWTVVRLIEKMLWAHMICFISVQVRRHSVQLWRTMRYTASIQACTQFSDVTSNTMSLITGDGCAAKYGYFDGIQYVLIAQGALLSGTNKRRRAGFRHQL